MSNKTNTGLVNHAAAQIGCCYWWGTFGQVAAPDLLAQKAAQYPEQYSAARQSTAKTKHMGKRVYDCCGLVKSYWMQESPAAAPKYNGKYDVNVSGLIKACTQTGAIPTLPETPGILVFRGTAHVGIYAGGGEVIEAKGFDYGVVRTKLSAGKWDKWGRLSWLDYGASPAQTSNMKEEIFVAEKTFKNTSGKMLDVFADTKLTIKVGSLPAGNDCKSLGLLNGRAILKYRVSGTNDYKVGFTDFVRGIQS